MVYTNKLGEISVNELFTKLKTSEKGLSTTEANNRLKNNGYNEILAKDRREALDILIAQFKSPLIIILIAAAFISYFLGEFTESIVIIFTVIVNAVLGFFQEYKAEKIIKELMKSVPLKVKALRDGVIIELNSRELVIGDVFKFDIGDIIPADGRIIYVQELTINESQITGESVPVNKSVAVSNSLRGIPSSVVLSGSSVSSGKGLAVVIATGINTEIGRIKEILSAKMPPSEFEKSITKFGDLLLKIIFVVTFLVFLANSIKGAKIVDSFLFALALAVGITPEALPVIITITLSNGARKMANKDVIIKKLASIEDMGNIDVLCSDKTGTLTEGKVTLIDYFNLEGKRTPSIIIKAMLCNNKNNAIDKAIIERSTKAPSLNNEFKTYKIIDENEFDFNRRRMSVIIEKNKIKELIVKGSPESILSISTHALINNVKTKINKKIIVEINKRINDYEKDGYTVIALGTKCVNCNKSTKDDENNIIIEGLLLLLDPPKESAKESLNMLQKLGIKVKILSGDSPLITKKICTDVGLKIVDDKIITGEVLDGLSKEKFIEYVEKYNVFARVSPEQKYMIVSSINTSKHIVGFLGDGVNDAPALREANVGITVNSATGVAREAADILLLQKSLNVLADGINQGRKTFGNIMKYILNTISGNFSNMITIAISSLFLTFIPLLPSQILLNNFLTDIPLTTLSTDNVDKEFLDKPKKWNISYIKKFMIYFGIICSAYDFLFITILLIMQVPVLLFRTAWFVEGILHEVIMTFAIRTRLDFYKSKPSKYLLITSIIICACTLIIPYVPVIGSLFAFVSIPFNILMIVLLVSALVFVTVEFGKKIFFKNNN